MEQIYVKCQVDANFVSMLSLNMWCYKCYLVKCNYLHAQTEKVFLLKAKNKQNLILAPALQQF